MKREKYIDFIKQYIAARPDYKDTIKEIKINVAMAGATDEEFDEAIAQLGVPHEITSSILEEVKPQQASKSQKHFFVKYLPTIAITRTQIFLGLVAFVGLTMIFYPLLSGEKKVKDFAMTAPVEVTPTPGVSTNKPLIPQVYATTKVIDAERVFSFPPSAITLKVTGIPKKKIFGFFPYWMIARSKDVSIDMLTTISLFGLAVDGKGNIITRHADGSDDQGWLMWNDKTALDPFLKRAQRKRISVELTLKAFDNSTIETLTTSDNAQTTFISNAIQLMNAKNLNGINLDFEYVGIPDESVSQGFTRLVANLAAELHRQSPKATLTIDTYLNAAATQGLFDVEALSNYVNYLVIMGYDVHTPSGDAGPLAPMEGEGNNVVGLLQSYLEKVAPEKLILAVPYYGYDWAVHNGVASGSDTHTLSYAEIAANSKQNTILWDKTAQTPWYRYIDSTTKQLREVHFENTRSLGIKYDFVNDKDLGGVGIWALGYDGRNVELEQLLVDKFSK